MSPKIEPFLDRLVHVHCLEREICHDGVLRSDGEALTFTGAPELRLPLHTLEWAHVEPEIGPREFADCPDLAMKIDGVFVGVFTVLRDPEYHPVRRDPELEDIRSRFARRKAAIEILRSLVGSSIAIRTNGNHQRRHGVLAAFHAAEGVLELTNGKRTVLPPLHSARVTDAKLRASMPSVQLVVFSSDDKSRRVGIYRDVLPDPKPKPKPDLPDARERTAHNIAGGDWGWEDVGEAISYAFYGVWFVVSWVVPIVALLVAVI